MSAIYASSDTDVYICLVDHVLVSPYAFSTLDDAKEHIDGLTADIRSGAEPAWRREDRAWTRGEFAVQALEVRLPPRSTIADAGVRILRFECPTHGTVARRTADAPSDGDPATCPLTATDGRACHEALTTAFGRVAASRCGKPLTHQIES